MLNKTHTWEPGVYRKQPLKRPVKVEKYEC